MKKARITALLLSALILFVAGQVMAAAPSDSLESVTSPGFREISPPPVVRSGASTSLQAVFSRDKYLVEHYEIHARLSDDKKLVHGSADLALHYLVPGLDRIWLIFGSSYARVDSVKRKTESLPYGYYQHGEAWPVPGYPFIYSQLDSLSISLGGAGTAAGGKDTLSIFFTTNLVNFYPADTTFQGNIAPRSLFSAYGDWHPALPDVYYVGSKYDVHLDLPSDYLVEGMGELVSVVDSLPGRRISHYRAEGPWARGPFPFAAGKYKAFEGRQGDIQVRVLLLEEDASNGGSMKDFLIENLARLREWYGVDYPFGKITVVEVERDRQGPSTTVPGIIYLDPEVVGNWGNAIMALSSRRVVLHELSHQWWGISLFAEDDYWITEGFAVLAELLHLEEKEGPAALDQALFQIWSYYLHYAKIDRKNVGMSSLDHSTFSYDRYYKSGWLLWQLRGRLGQEVFASALHSFLTAHMFSAATTRDWQAACEQASGQSLSGFFDQWYYNPGFPWIKVRWEHKKRQDSQLGTVDEAWVYLDQHAPVFSLDLDFEVRLQNGGAVKEKRQVDKASQIEVFSLPSPPDSLILDPARVWLMQVDYSVITRLLAFGDTPNNAYPYPVELYIDSLLPLSKVELVYTVNGGPESTVDVPLATMHSGAASPVIPPQTTGSRVEYYLRYIDADGLIYQYPDSAPARKYSFSITGKPSGTEHLLLSMIDTEDSRSMLLYDTQQQRVIGSINGYGGRKVGWSRDGSLALVADIIGNNLTLLDINNFRILWNLKPELRLYEKSGPLFLPDNSFAFVPVINGDGSSGNLLKLDLRDGSAAVTAGFSPKTYATSDPVLIQSNGNIVFCGSDKLSGDIARAGYLFIVDPATNSVLRRERLGQAQCNAVSVDSLGKRFFILGGNSVRVVSLDPLKTEFDYRFYCYIDSSIGPPLGGKELTFDPFLAVSADAAGAIAYQNITPKCDAFTGVVYWDIGDRLQPLHNIELAPYFISMAPWFTASHDGEKLWFFIPKAQAGQPGLLQYDLKTQSFVEPLILTGLSETGGQLGLIFAYQSPRAFGVSVVLRGDASGDGVLNVFDLLQLLKELGRGGQPSGLSRGVDVNSDGKLDVFDLLGLLKLLAN